MFANRSVPLLVFILILGLGPGYAQKKSKDQLQKEKKEKLRKIEEVEEILLQTTSKKKNSIGELNALQEQIKQRAALINNMKAEIGILNEEIAETNQIIEALENDLKNLKQEYASMIYTAYKNNQKTNKLALIFSSNSIDQMFTRLKYLEQYSAVRKKQVVQITKVQEALSSQVTVIKERKKDQSQLLNEQLSEAKKLESLRIRKDQVVRALSKEERSIKKELVDTEKSIAKLNEMIDDIIKAEIAAASKRDDTGKLKLTPEALKLSASFAGNKSKLPWPVEKGFISQRFGRVEHPTIKHNYINNKGVKIQTAKDQEVRAVFNGQVTTVGGVKDYGRVVFIRHGEYFTIYANLKEVNVKVGQKVSTKDVIGKVASTINGHTEMEFQVRKSTSPQDPAKWLYNR